MNKPVITNMNRDNAGLTWSLVQDTSITVATCLAIYVIDKPCAEATSSMVVCLIPHTMNMVKVPSVVLGVSGWSHSAAAAVAVVKATSRNNSHRRLQTTKLNKSDSSVTDRQTCIHTDI